MAALALRLTASQAAPSKLHLPCNISSYSSLPVFGWKGSVPQSLNNKWVNETICWGDCITTNYHGVSCQPLWFLHSHSYYWWHSEELSKYGTQTHTLWRKKGLWGLVLRINLIHSRASRFSISPFLFNLVMEVVLRHALKIDDCSGVKLLSCEQLTCLGMLMICFCWVMKQKSPSAGLTVSLGVGAWWWPDFHQQSVKRLMARDHW